MTRFIVIVSLLSSFAWGQSGQVLRDGVLTDHDFLFVLKVRGADELVPEMRARSLASNALAAVVHRDGGLSFVVVEPDMDKGLDHWVAVTAKADGLKKMDWRDEGTTAVSGVTAHRFSHAYGKGRNAYRAQHVLVVRGGYVYRLTTRKPGAKSSAEDSTFQRALRSFSLLKGTINPRIGGDSELVSGAGWEAQGDQFQTATFGFKATAPKGFRLMIGEELEREAAGAAVGITNGRVWIAIIGFRAATSDKKEFRQRLDDFMAGQFLTRSGRIEGKLLGKKIELTKLESRKDAEARALHGAIFNAKFCLQTIIGYRKPNEAEAVELTPTLLATVAKLPSGQKSKLLARLKERQARAYQMGSDFSVRGGTYRDFKHHFTWTQPSALWSMKTGRAAQSRYPKTRLSLNNEANGLLAFVSTRAMPSGRSLEQAHASELKGYAGKLRRTKKLKVSGYPALMTRRSLAADIHFDFQLCSIRAKDRIWHIAFGAMPENMTAAQRDISKASSSSPMTSTPTSSKKASSPITAPASASIPESRAQSSATWPSPSSLSLGVPTSSRRGVSTPNSRLSARAPIPKLWLTLNPGFAKPR